MKIGRWVVDFLFAKRSYDIEGVSACLYDAGANASTIKRAVYIMTEGGYNCGFTFGDEDRRRAVVMVGPTTSGKEFLNTFSHEIDHLSDIIADSLGIKENREGTSYLTGDTTMALAEVLCELGCEHCRRVK